MKGVSHQDADEEEKLEGGVDSRVWREGVSSSSKYLSDYNSGDSNNKDNDTKKMTKRAAWGDK